MEDAGIEIERIGDGVEILLPFRDLGAAKKAGGLPILFGSFATVFMAFWTGTPISWGIAMINQGDPIWFGALFMAFGSLGFAGLFFAVKIIIFGIVILRNRTRCSILIEEKTIVSKEHVGWFSHKTKVYRHKIEQLYVVPIASAVNSAAADRSNASAPDFLTKMFGAELENRYAISIAKRNSSMLALGYPKEIVESVAKSVAEELNRDLADPVTIIRDPGSKPGSEKSSFVTVQNLTTDEVLDADYVLPENSHLEIVQEDESVVYRVPERGLLKGSSGLFAFSILWNGFMVIFTSGVIFGNANGIDWMFAAAAVLFWAVGISMLVASIYMAKQSALIGVQDGLLFIERKTIFGTKWNEFSADQIVSIEMASTNMEVNDVPIMNLSIEPAEGKPVRMFASLDDAELQWLAQQLRRAIGIGVKKSK